MEFSEEQKYEYSLSNKVNKWISSDPMNCVQKLREAIGKEVRKRFDVCDIRYYVLFQPSGIPVRHITSLIERRVWDL